AFFTAIPFGFTPAEHAAWILEGGGQRWRMVTAWPKNLPGPGFSAQRIADRITTLSAGRVAVQVFAAGELVPAFAVQEAVGNATVELGHTAS
ncbi:hypothetical protein, partial [Klebsiella pneumoniae]|uniref:hypothetical protein n=1 Tax=Klebsiella pneumoniae TaxID=573 RepID=UPI001954EEBD